MNATRLVVSYARTHGVDVEQLLAELKLEPATLENPDGRVPLPLQRRAWELVAARLRDSALGLRIAEYSVVGTFEALDYALWASSTLEDALCRVAKFYRLIGDDLELHIVRRGGWARLHRVVIHDQRERAEFFFAFLTLRARELLAKPFRVREVRFAHREPVDPRPHRALFGCPVRFGCSMSELVFDGAHLSHPITSARPGLAVVLDRYMVDLLARLPGKDSFLHRVHHAVARSLPGSPPSLAATARALHASPRTVQRYLQRLGVTHRAVVEDVRRDIADRLLFAGHLSIGEIAFLLGYQDAGGFRRAYRRWTGSSPSERRRN